MDDVSSITLKDGSKLSFNQADVDARMIELQAEYNVQEYARDRQVDYPLIGDPELKIVRLYDMLPADAGETCEGRTPADNATARSVFIIGPDKKIKATLTYPMTTGRNFDEVLRLLDSCQLTSKHNVATPVNWQNGDDVIIPPAVSDEVAKEKFPDGWDSPKPYLRITKQPTN